MRFNKSRVDFFRMTWKRVGNIRLKDSAKILSWPQAAAQDKIESGVAMCLGNNTHSPFFGPYGIQSDQSNQCFNIIKNFIHQCFKIFVSNVARVILQNPKFKNYCQSEWTLSGRHIPRDCRPYRHEFLLHFIYRCSHREQCTRVGRQLQVCHEENGILTMLMLTKFNID